MALSGNTTWEMRTTGNDTNGGGFVTGAAGTDYSQQDAKNTVGADISTTDAVANGTTTLTSATANFGTTIVGNIIYLQGGTGALAASRYQITARTNTTTITLDRSVATGTGITMNIGGAFLTLGNIGSTTATIPVNGNRIFIKAGTYIQTTVTTNVSGGGWSKGIDIYIEGYNTVRGDMGTPPVLQADGVIINFSMINLFGSIGIVKNIHFNGNNRTGSKGINLQTPGAVFNCIFTNCVNSGVAGSAGTFAYNCIASGCSGSSAYREINCFNCVAHTCTGIGFGIGLPGGTLSRCIAYNCSGGTTDGFSINSRDMEVINCTSYNSGRDGFRTGSPSVANIMFINCISEDNAGIGFNNANNTAGINFINCAAFSNATDFSIGTSTYNKNLNPITYTASAFTAPGSGNFSLNSAAGGGALLKASGIPGVFPGGLTTGFLDIGAAQSSGGAGPPAAVEHSSVF